MKMTKADALKRISLMRDQADTHGQELNCAALEFVLKRAAIWEAVDWDDVLAIVEGSTDAKARTVVYSKRRAAFTALRAALEVPDGEG